MSPSKFDPKPHGLTTRSQLQTRKIGGHVQKLANGMILKLWGDFGEPGSADLYLAASSSDVLSFWCPSNRLFL